jgi:hypothetical protein
VFRQIAAALDFSPENGENPFGNGDRFQTWMAG